MGAGSYWVGRRAVVILGLEVNWKRRKSWEGKRRRGGSVEGQAEEVEGAVVD